MNKTLNIIIFILSVIITAYLLWSGLFALNYIFPSVLILFFWLSMLSPLVCLVGPIVYLIVTILIFSLIKKIFRKQINNFIERSKKSGKSLPNKSNLNSGSIFNLISSLLISSAITVVIHTSYINDKLGSIVSRSSNNYNINNINFLFLFFLIGIIVYLIINYFSKRK